MTSNNRQTGTVKRADGRALLRQMTRATRAEILKLATLPSVTTLTLLTIVCAALMVGALANSQPGGVPHSGATGTAAATVQLLRPLVLFLQVGPIVLGILAVTQEYAGSQGSTTLRSTPQRGVAVASKLVAVLAAQLVLAAVVVAASWCAAYFLLDSAPGPAGTSIVHPAANLATMALYLASAGMISSGIALVTRSLASALVTSLALLLLAPPLLAAVPTLAQRLPSNVGPAGLAAWVAVTLAIGATSFIRRDG